MLIIHIFFVLLGITLGRTQQQQINNFDEIKFNQQNRATIVNVPNLANNNPLPILAVASSASSSSNSQPVSSFAAASFSSNNIPAVQQSPSNKPGPSNNGQNQTFSIPKAMLSFALEMTRCRSESDSDCSSNMVFSPLSIISTLTMVLMGTGGQCYAQLRSALGYHDDASDTDINGAYRFLMERIKKLDAEAGSSILLSVANGLFSQTQSKFSIDYINKAKDFYQSEVAELDIMRNPYGSANSINKWVAERTNGKITNILSSLPPDTQMVVANAVYFNANWADPFAPEVTRMEKFYVMPNDILYVPTMLQHALVAYGENSELNCKMIGIPYKGEELGMFILLPTEQEGLKSLNRLEAKLNVDLLEQIFSRLESKTVSIQLPKFRIQQKLQLKNALRDLGVTDLFSPAAADLSRMTSKSGVALDNIVHQTFIEVTESGTEAAAATVLNLSRDGPSKSFVANQPFLFLIRDIPSKATLFIGRVVRPAESSRTF